MELIRYCLFWLRLFTPAQQHFCYSNQRFIFTHAGKRNSQLFWQNLPGKKKHSFLIETHSDYIIDRVRISVRDKILKPKDVSILYFDPGKTGSAVTIHNIKMDKQGNLVNAPPSYRDFFMKETDKLLGFDENG